MAYRIVAHHYDPEQDDQQPGDDPFLGNLDQDMDELQQLYDEDGE